MTTEAPTGWRNRIVAHGTEAPDQLLAHPSNFRIHPKAQQDHLAAVLDQVGFVQDVIVNQRTGHVVDGHLRVELAISRGEESIPVVYVDLDEDEERLVLATFDPISAMAVPDREILRDLIESIEADDERVAELLSVISGEVPDFDPNAEWVGMPEFEQEDQTAWASVIVHFKNADDLASFSAMIGQPLTEKTKSIWHPEAEIKHYRGKEYIADDEP